MSSAPPKQRARREAPAPPATSASPLSCLQIPHSAIQHLSWVGDLSTPQLLDAVMDAIPKSHRDVPPVFGVSPQLRYAMARQPSSTFDHQRYAGALFSDDIPIPPRFAEDPSLLFDETTWTEEEEAFFFARNEFGFSMPLLMHEEVYCMDTHTVKANHFLMMEKILSTLEDIDEVEFMLSVSKAYGEVPIRFYDGNYQFTIYKDVDWQHRDSLDERGRKKKLKKTTWTIEPSNSTNFTSSLIIDGTIPQVWPYQLKVPCPENTVVETKWCVKWDDKHDDEGRPFLILTGFHSDNRQHVAHNFSALDLSEWSDRTQLITHFCNRAPHLKHVVALDNWSHLCEIENSFNDCEQLEMFAVRHCKNLEFVDGISGPSLTSIDLSGCDNLTSFGFAFMGRSYNMEKLTLSERTMKELGGRNLLKYATIDLLKDIKWQRSQMRVRLRFGADQRQMAAKIDLVIETIFARADRSDIRDTWDTNTFGLGLKLWWLFILDDIYAAFDVESRFNSLCEEIAAFVSVGVPLKLAVLLIAGEITNIWSQMTVDEDIEDGCDFDEVQFLGWLGEKLGGEFVWAQPHGFLKQLRKNVTLWKGEDLLAVWWFRVMQLRTFDALKQKVETLYGDVNTDLDSVAEPAERLHSALSAQVMKVVGKNRLREVFSSYFSYSDVQVGDTIDEIAEFIGYELDHRRGSGHPGAFLLDTASMPVSYLRRLLVTESSYPVV